MRIEFFIFTEIAKLSTREFLYLEGTFKNFYNFLPFCLDQLLEVNLSLWGIQLLLSCLLSIKM